MYVLIVVKTKEKQPYLYHLISVTQDFLLVLQYFCQKLLVTGAIYCYGLYQ